MTFDVNARAPGKILWIGGYSVLERPNIGFVTTVKAYVNVNIKSNDWNGVELNAPQLNMSAKGSVEVSSGKLNVDTPKELLLLKTAIEVAGRYASGTGAKINGITVTTKNDDQFSYSVSEGKVVKSGLGSSAALTVAAVAGVLKAFEVHANKNQIHKLAQVAHSIATGKVGSGFDIAAATYGSIVYSRYSPDIVKNFPVDYTNEDLAKIVKKRWDYTVEKLSLPKELRLVFANFVGEAMITTAGVGSVSEFKKNNPDRYSELVRSINDQNVKAVEALKKLGGGSTEAYALFEESFEKGRVFTKELGVLSGVGIEPNDCTKLIEGSKMNGAFLAKLPGAGGKDAIAALVLSRKDETRLKRYWKKNKALSLLKLKIGSMGLQY
jgi:phosphomevalonate kinase